MRALQKIVNGRKTLCFLDLEGTQFSHEMIAIGALKVDLKKDGSVKKIAKPFYSLVIPKNKVGKIVVDLTGLTDEKIKKEGKKLREVMQGLKKYLGKSFTSTLFITYGNHDARILAQSQAYNLDAPTEDIKIMIKHNFDLAEFMYQYIKDEHGNSYSLSNALNEFHVDFKGTKHNALADTYNLVYLYEALIEHPEIVAVHYKDTIAKSKQYPECVHKLINKLVNNESVTPEEFEKLILEEIK